METKPYIQVRLNYSGKIDKACCRYCRKCRREKDSFFGYCFSKEIRVVLSTIACNRFDPHAHVEVLNYSNQLTMF